MIVMDMDAHKVSEIIGGDPRFVSPFEEPCGYYIAAPDEAVDETMIALYWERLQYAAKNADWLVQQGFHPSYYTFYGINQGEVKSPDDMCRRLIFDSFVLILQDGIITVGCCLSNSAFMFGHYIGLEWDRDWNLLSSYIC